MASNIQKVFAQANLSRLQCWYELLWSQSTGSVYNTSHLWCHLIYKLFSHVYITIYSAKLLKLKKNL